MRQPFTLQTHIQKFIDSSLNILYNDIKSKLTRLKVMNFVADGASGGKGWLI
jgi:hypothetical protein